MTTAVVTTWPLATALGRAVPTPWWNCLGNGCEDEFLCVWIVTTLGNRLLTAPRELFEGGILWPLKHTLAFSETMLSTVALTAPVTWITGNAVLAYDLYYLATVALSVLGTFLLLREITGDPRAALPAALLFGLAGERWLDRGHLAKLSVQWVPFVCWTWIRFLDRPTIGRAAALGATLLANLHAGVYQGLLVPLLLVPWAALLALARRWSWCRWTASLLVLGATFAIGLVGYWPFAVVRNEFSFTTGGGTTEVPGGWAWYLGAFAEPHAYLARLAAPGRAIVAATPLPALALLAAGLVAAARRPRVPAPQASDVHLVAMAAFTLAAAAVSVHTERLGAAGPLVEALFMLPGLDGLRGRSRITVLVTFGGAVLLGIALASILRRVRRGLPAALLAGLVAVAVVVDTRVLKEPAPLSWLPGKADLPPALALAVQTDPHGGLLHLPYGHWASETIYMMWALHHDRPLMNGYTAVMPRFGPIIRELPSAEARRALADAGVTHVLIHTKGRIGLAVRTILTRLRDSRDVRQLAMGDDILVTIDRPPDGPAPLVGRPLPRDGWRLDASDPDASRAADGDVRTHWIAHAIDRPTFLRVDLGTVHPVTGLRLAFGPHLRDYPHAWEAWGSLDGAQWERLAGANPTEPPFASYRLDHHAIVLDLALPETSVRFLELRVPALRPLSLFDGHGDGNWGVHELEVFGP